MASKILARLFLTAVLCCTFFSPAYASEPPFLSGLRPPTAQEASWIESRSVWKTATRGVQSALPSSVKNIEFLPAVARQSLPNCGAFAPTYYMKTYLEARKHGWGRVDPRTHSERATSPGIAYAFGMSDDDGASIGGVISLMTIVGALPLSRLPDSYNYDRLTYPPARLFLEAMGHRGGEVVAFDAEPYKGLTEGGFWALKEWLADGEIAVFALDVSLPALYEYGRDPDVPYVNNDVIYGMAGTGRKGHAFTLIGYDDEKTYFDGTVEKQGAFYGVNSWGTTWGVQGPDGESGGYFWIGYEYFRDNARSVLSMTLRDETEPELAGIFQYDHRYAAQVSMNFWGGAETGPDWKSPWANTSPGEDAPYDPSHPLAVNLTSSTGDPSEAFWWRMSDSKVIGQAEGEAVTFRIYRHADLMEALPQRLFSMDEGGQYQWHITPLSHVEAPYLDGTGLPAATASVPSFTDVYIGMMAEGEEILDSPMTFGSLIFADLNGSGLPDLISVGGQTQVYENMGGTFRKVEGHGLPDLTHAAADVADFDGDGLPDIAVCGSMGWDRATRVYRNLGNFGFQDIEADLPGVTGSDTGLWASIAWGDFDNDGLADLAFWGFAEDSTKHVHVFRNNGDGTFEAMDFGLPQHHGAQLAWLDVTANGWLDLTAGTHVFLNTDGVLDPTPVGTDQDVGAILYRGSGVWADFTGNGLPDVARTESYTEWIGGTRTTGYRIRFLHNKGDGEFEDSGITIPNVGYARMAAADYNNTGRMDLASVHQSGDFGGWFGTDTPRTTALYRQLPDGTFRSAGFNMLGMFDGGVALADIDGDGALDVLASGHIRTDDDSTQSAARLYRSRFADAPLLARPNTAPTPPTDLAAEHDPTLGRSIFTWNHGDDAETTQAALTYNVRIGTLPGLGDIYSPASSAPVTSTVRTYRIDPDQPGLILRDLRPGYYYWSVRTVDGGRLVSDWSPTQTFAIDGFDPRDVNRDDVFDVADLVMFTRMLDQFRDHLPLAFDFNDDGVVNQADLRTLAKILTGSHEPFPGSYEVGSEGGTVTQDILEIVVPEGAIPEGQSAVLTIERVSDVFDGADVETGYRITGLPAITSKPLRIYLEPEIRLSAEPVMFIGEEVLAKGAAEISLRYRIITPEVAEDGRLWIEIPALLPDEDEGESGITRSARTEENTYSLNLGVLGGYAKLAGPRFSISFPQRFVGDAVENLMKGFEDCYPLLRDVYGFSYAGRTNWPVEVCVRDLGIDEDGAMLSSLWGDNYGTIEINSRILDNKEKSRATACHEFFHLVQGLYDPRSRRAKARSMSRHYWLDEASSTWAESLVVTNPRSYLPETYHQNIEAPYQGVASGMLPDDWRGRNRTPVINYGYGMAPLPRYLVEKVEKTALRDVYAGIRAVNDPVSSLQDAVFGVIGRTILFWYDDFFRQLVTNELYSLPAQSLIGLVGRPGLFTIEPDRPSTVRHFPVQTTDLSGALHMLRFHPDYPEPEADSMFAVRYKGDPLHSLHLFKTSGDDSPEWIDAVFDPDEVKFITVPGAQTFKAKQQRLLALVTDTNADSGTTPPYTTKREGVLAMGLARPGPLELPPHEFSSIAYNHHFPRFTGQGEIKTEAVSDFYDTPVRHWRNVGGALWGGDKIELELSYQAEIEKLQVSSKDWLDRDVTLSTSDIKGYNLYMAFGDDVKEFFSENGEFSITIDRTGREDESVQFDLRAVTDLTYHLEEFSPWMHPAEHMMALYNFTLP